MPDWSPPESVRFDHAAANALITQIRLTRNLLVDVTEAVRRTADDAQDSWFGGPAERAALAVARHSGHLAAALRELDQLARSLMAATDDAGAEQRRRQHSAQQWATR